MFMNCKYEKWYFSIIGRALCRGHKKSGLDFYTEAHHIIPKSMGGSGKRSNMVLLTSREHYICHHLLTKMVVDEGHRVMMWNAFFLMHISPSENIRYTTSRGYCMAKRMMSDGKRGVPSWNKGIPATESHKDKLSTSWNRDAHRNVDKNKYHFESDEGDSFHGTRVDFCKYSGLNQKFVYKIVSKTQEKTKGWRVSWEKEVTL